MESETRGQFVIKVCGTEFHENPFSASRVLCTESVSKKNVLSFQTLDLILQKVCQNGTWRGDTTGDRTKRKMKHPKKKKN
jgi:azurin